MTTPIWFRALTFIRKIIKGIMGHEYSCCNNVFKKCGRCKYVLEEE